MLPFTLYFFYMQTDEGISALNQLQNLEELIVSRDQVSRTGFESNTTSNLLAE